MVWPVGLQNLGNTCFLNSVLQALTYSDVLFEAVEESTHGHSCASKRSRAQLKASTSHASHGNPGQLRNSSGVDCVLAVDGRGATCKTDNCVLCALERHIKTARQLSSEKEKYLSSRNPSSPNNQSMSGRTDISSYSLNNSRDRMYFHNDGRNENLMILSPSEIVELLPVLSSSLRKGRQEDAHECLNALVTSSAICCGDFINCSSALNAHNDNKNKADRSTEDKNDENGCSDMKNNGIEHSDVHDRDSNTHNGTSTNTSGNGDRPKDSSLNGMTNKSQTQCETNKNIDKNSDKNGKPYNQSELDLLYGNSDFIKDYLTAGVKLDKSKLSRNIADLAFIPFLHADSENHNTANNNGKTEKNEKNESSNSNHANTKNHQSGAKSVKCSKKDSYFTDLFRGSVVNTVRCSACRTQSAHIEPVLGLQLDIARASTVRSALGECFG
jgi:Ubiquitin carboxyl-terminal hydrolase